MPLRESGRPGAPPCGHHPPEPKRVETTKPPPMSDGYVSRVSGPRTEVVTRGPPGEPPGCPPPGAPRGPQPPHLTYPSHSSQHWTYPSNLATRPTPPNPAPDLPVKLLPVRHLPVKPCDHSPTRQPLTNNPPTRQTLPSKPTDSPTRQTLQQRNHLPATCPPNLPKPTQTWAYPAKHHPSGIWGPPDHLPGNAHRASHHHDTAPPVRGEGLSAPLPEGAQGLAPGHDSLDSARHAPLLCSPSTHTRHDNPNGAYYNAWTKLCQP